MRTIDKGEKGAQKMSQQKTIESSTDAHNTITVQIMARQCNGMNNFFGKHHVRAPMPLHYSRMFIHFNQFRGKYELYQTSQALAK